MIRRLFLLLLLALSGTGFAYSQTEETPLTEKQLRRSYRGAVRHYANDAVSAFFDQLKEVPPGYAALSSHDQFTLKWNYQNPDDLILNYQMELMPLEKGDVVADIGIGNGAYEASWLLHGIDDVTVYGLDVDSVALGMIPGILNYCEKFVPFYNSIVELTRDHNPDHFLSLPQSFQVIPHINTFESTCLPDESVDKMVCIRTLHHLSPAFLEDMYRTLKSGGYLYIADRVAKKPYKQHCHDAVEKADRVYYLAYDQIIELLEDAGFVFENEELTQGSGYFLFSKP